MLFEPDEREIRKKRYIEKIKSRKVEKLIAPLKDKLEKYDSGEIEPEEIFRTAGYVAREGGRITGDFKKRTDVILAGIAMDENLCMSTVGDIGVSVRRGKVTDPFSDLIVVPFASGGKIDAGAAADVKAAGGKEIERELASAGDIDQGIIVTGPGELHCRHIVHINTLDEESGKVTPESAHAAVSSALAKAEELEAGTVAIAEISSGPEGTDIELIARAVLDAIRSHSGEEVSRIVLVSESEETAGIYVDGLDIHE